MPSDASDEIYAELEARDFGTGQDDVEAYAAAAGAAGGAAACAALGLGLASPMCGELAGTIAASIAGELYSWAADLFDPNSEERARIAANARYARAFFDLQRAFNEADRELAADVYTTARELVALQHRLSPGSTWGPCSGPGCSPGVEPDSIHDALILLAQHGAPIDLVPRMQGATRTYPDAPRPASIVAWQMERTARGNVPIATQGREAAELIEEHYEALRRARSLAAAQLAAEVAIDRGTHAQRFERIRTGLVRVTGTAAAAAVPATPRSAAPRFVAGLAIGAGAGAIVGAVLAPYYDGRRWVGGAAGAGAGAAFGAILAAISASGSERQGA